MFRPELYENVNLIPRKDALAYLKRFTADIKWRNVSSAIDIGCGEGSVTTTVLRKFLPADHQRLVGSDISELMVAHANKVHGDTRTHFVVWDMSAPVPTQFYQTFDLVFSNYAIHWVQKQEKVLRNVLRLLSPGGTCVLLFVGYTSIYDVYRVLAKQNKWAHWLRNAEEYISPYQDIEEPEKYIQKIMATVGFDDIDVINEHKICVYELEHFKTTIKSINPFKLPKDLLEEYLEDYIEASRSIMPMNTIENKTYVDIHYSYIAVHGLKGN